VDHFSSVVDKMFLSCLSLIYFIQTINFSLIVMIKVLIVNRCRVSGMEDGPCEAMRSVSDENVSVRGWSRPDKGYPR
jgi:hypothetical protein